MVAYKNESDMSLHFTATFLPGYWEFWLQRHQSRKFWSTGWPSVSVRLSCSAASSGTRAGPSVSTAGSILAMFLAKKKKKHFLKFHEINFFQFNCGLMTIKRLKVQKHILCCFSLAQDATIERKSFLFLQTNQSSLRPSFQSIIVEWWAN